MEDKKNELLKARKEAMPFLILMYLGLAVLIAGLVIVIIQSATKSKDNALFISGIVLLCSALVLTAVSGIVGNKKVSAYNKLKKDLKNNNKQ